eukprot:jgi/Ulvmu1/3862/UM018_0081.1
MPDLSFLACVQHSQQPHSSALLTQFRQCPPLALPRQHTNSCTYAGLPTRYHSTAVMDPYAPRTNPAPRADVRSRLPIRPSDDKYTSLTEVTAWLRERGVSKGKAREFLRRSGCTSVDGVALYLRFQLPPLQFANVDCINEDMNELMGVTHGKARRIIQDLDIMNCINLDTNEEAVAHLSATGLLSQHSHAGASGLVVTPTASSSVPRVTGLPTAAGQPPSPPPGAILPQPTTPPSAHDNPNPYDRCHEPRSSTSSRYKMRAVAEGRERPDGSTEAWSTSSINWAGVEGGEDAPDAVEDDVGSVHSIHSAVSAGRAARPNSGGPPTSVGSGNGRPTRRAQPAAHSPLAPLSARQHSARSTHSMQRRNGSSDPNSMSAIPAGPAGPMFPALDGSPSIHSANPADASMSIDICQSNPATPAGGGGSQSQVLGYPTVSSPLEPGPYHKANAQLRRQLPHLHVDVTVQTRWDHILLTLLAFLAFVIYIGTRCFYLTSGRTAQYTEQNINVTYSYIVLMAEIFLGGLGFYGHQLFWKQLVKFEPMDSNTLRSVSEDVAQNGIRETVHVLVTTYTEPADTVRECIIRLLVAPEPVYMEKVLYVCDDGHSKSEGPRKRAMVDELRVLGHTNVFYVGDRVKRPGQLNGKSANLNHVVLQKIFPTIQSAAEIPAKDILMVVDCDHMAKPDIFNKMGPCMLDEAVAVTLVPQWFHNLIFPDAFDSANADFMFAKMPYCFGAGMCYITGTNVMIRAKAAFQVCKFASANLAGLEDGIDRRQIYAEDEISEDIELGSRMHAWGFKSIFVGERLATGEVPLDLRSMWRQRLRWLKGGHLFILSPGSVFFKRQPHMSFYQKSLYWLCPVAHFIQLFFEPIIFTLPFLCLVFSTCPYGMDPLLFWTHVGHLGMSFIYSTYHLDLVRIRIAFSAKGGYRVLWFTSVKACINTIMVHTGWKNPGHFKFTPKAGISAEEAAVSGALSVSEANSKSGDGKEDGSSGGGSGKDGKPAPDKKPFALSQVHAGLSRVTESRKKVMPLDGTFDIWILLITMAMSLLAAAVGIKRLYDRGALIEWDDGRNGLIWIGVVFAVVDATPGMLFLGYAAVYDCAPWLLKIYVPFLTFCAAAAVTLIEVRVAYGFATGN